MESIEVLEEGKLLSFRFDEMLNYHGPGFPGGVAHGFKVMQRAFPLLDDGNLLERREISFVTAFPGPGARDAFELVTRCLTDGRDVGDKEPRGGERAGESRRALLLPVELPRAFRRSHAPPRLRAGGIHSTGPQEGAHGGGGACACRNETRHGRPPDGGQSGGYLSS